jgi:hypothetical protein
VDGDAGMAADVVDLRALVYRLCFDISEPPVQRRVSTDDNRGTAGDGELEVDVPAIATMTMRDLDDDMASANPAVKSAGVPW